MSFPEQRGVWSSERVVAFRRALKVTQHEFAAFLGVHVTTVNRWERGHPLSKLARQRLDEAETKMRKMGMLDVEAVSDS